MMSFGRIANTPSQGEGPWLQLAQKRHHSGKRGLIGDTPAVQKSDESAASFLGKCAGIHRKSRGKRAKVFNIGKKKLAKGGAECFRGEVLLSLSHAGASRFTRKGPSRRPGGKEKPLENRERGGPGN